MKTLTLKKPLIHPEGTMHSWEQRIKKKVNFIALLSIINLAIGLIYFLISGVSIIITEIIFALIALPFVFLTNKYINFIWATYWFYITDFIFTVLITLKLGIDSYIILSIFPMVISMMQLLGRKETLKHLIILSGACVISILVIIIGLQLGNLTVKMDPISTRNLASIIIFLCFTSTIFLSVTMIKEFIQQEEITKKALLEKEILLAEVYHRVKNNLNIITSLLNLRKNASDSKEVIEALEVCQNRVFSIALVHQNMVNNSNNIGLNFRSYIFSLSNEIKKSLEIEGESVIHFDCDELELDMSKAIPCGLIMNELITNSFKHARQKDQVLQISISLKDKNETLELIIQDNGPGIITNSIENNQKMGLDLITSLAEQIDGEVTFENKNGLRFQLTFKQDKSVI